MSSRSVLIIGGGIVGLSAAYHLARRGAAVTLIDADPDDETSASAGNAGLIAVGHAPLPRPGLTTTALKWMLSPTSPLHIPFSLRPDLIAWLWNFRRACRRAYFDESLAMLAEHGHHAGAEMRRLIEDEGLDCGYEMRGQMDVYRTETALARGRHEAEELARLGYESEVLSGQQLRQREPAFREEVAGAINYTDRAWADPNAFMNGLRDAARRNGATIVRGRQIKALDVDNGGCVGATTTDGARFGADVTLLAAGAWSTPIAASAGVKVPMEAGKGYHLELPLPEPVLGTSCLLAETFVAVTPLPGRLRLAGTLEFSGINDRMRDARLRMLPAGADAYLHGIRADEAENEWCGLRPCTADGRPVLGWAPRVERLYIATGHGMMGFTLGPLAGRLACECILDGEPSVSIELMSPARF